MEEVLVDLAYDSSMHPFLEEESSLKENNSLW